jgi:hypothetical protein
MVSAVRGTITGDSIWVVILAAKKSPNKFDLGSEDLGLKSRLCYFLSGQCNPLEQF